VGRATAYIRDHFAEPLTLVKVARVAGLAPTYFSTLFSETERVGFHGYVQRLRLDRARHMLASTTLSVERVGQLCGFRSRNRFHVAFKRSLGVTPHDYRSDKN
jgi:AraC-like DNA-binding protein